MASKELKDSKTEQLTLSASQASTEPVRPAKVSQDISLAPPVFQGTPSEDAIAWAKNYERYIMFRQLGTKQAANLFPLLLKDVALTWFNEKFSVTPSSIDQVLAAFKERFAVSEATKWKLRSQIWRRQQQENESVDSFVTDMHSQAAKLNMDPNELRDAITQGLKSSIRSFVLQKEPKTLADLYKTALLAESTVSTEQSSLAEQIEQSVRMMKRMEAKIDGNIVSQCTYSPVQQPEKFTGSRMGSRPSPTPERQNSRLPRNPKQAYDTNPQQSRYQQRGQGRRHPIDNGISGRMASTMCTNC